jgi:hypothetical protein
VVLRNKLCKNNTAVHRKVKYLGLASGMELTWRAQLEKVRNRAYKAFWTSRCTFGETQEQKSTGSYYV